MIQFANRLVLIWINNETGFHPAAQVHRAGASGISAVTTLISPLNPLLLNGCSASALPLVPSL